MASDIRCSALHHLHDNLRCENEKLTEFTAGVFELSRAGIHPLKFFSIAQGLCVVRHVGERTSTEENRQKIGERKMEIGECILVYQFAVIMFGLHFFLLYVPDRFLPGIIFIMFICLVCLFDSKCVVIAVNIISFVCPF